MPRNTETVNINDAIKDFVEKSGFVNKFDEATIVNIWKTVMGNSIANRTRKIYLSDGVLHILVDSGPLRNKLFYDQQKVMDLLNEKLEKPIVQKVVVR